MFEAFSVAERMFARAIRGQSGVSRFVEARMSSKRRRGWLKVAPRPNPNAARGTISYVSTPAPSSPAAWSSPWCGAPSWTVERRAAVL
jgi:hypothetical protein